MRSKPVEIFFKIREITYWRSSFYKPVLNTLLNVCCLKFFIFFLFPLMNASIFFLRIDS